MQSFWHKMKLDNGSVLCLAPMADVTDSAFRYVIAKNSKQNPDNHAESLPYVTYTEFVSADGLVLAPEVGRAKLLKDLVFAEIERPIVAQFFSSRPQMMERAGALALELGFDGVDINMGCPDRSIEKQGAGASLIKNPSLARELISALKQGVQNKIPVSVKTRLGYHQDQLEEWLPALLAEQPSAIVLHARTRQEMSKVPARWARIARAVEIRNDLQNTMSPENDFRRLASLTEASTRKNSAEFYPCSENDSLGTSQFNFETLIIGNGDVVDLEDAKQKCKETGADGAMLGRAVFGNPFIFSSKQATASERLQALMEHINLFEINLGGIKSFAVMKKHFKSYLTMIVSADPDVARQAQIRELGSQLMLVAEADQAIHLIKQMLSLYN